MLSELKSKLCSPPDEAWVSFMALLLAPTWPELRGVPCAVFGGGLLARAGFFLGFAAAEPCVVDEVGLLA